MEDEDSPNFEFVNEIVGGVVPKEYIPAVDERYTRAMEQWRDWPGYPVLDVKALPCTMVHSTMLTPNRNGV